jgi:hypothetical protein
MSRRWLQAINGLVALATIGLGGIQLVRGVGHPAYAALGLPPSPILDSNLRFFGGMALALGLLLLWVIPRIERRTVAYRIIWLTALAGGIGRLLSMGLVGPPPDFVTAFTVLEVVGAPLLIYWQSRVARSTGS